MPHLIAKGKGAIVNTASEAGLRGSAAGAAYTASKHGIVGLTRSTAIMYRGSGVRTNAIAPGATITNIGLDLKEGAHGPSVLAAYMGNIGRVSEAEEQAAAIVFLASDAASNINGVVLPEIQSCNLIARSWRHTCLQQHDFILIRKTTGNRSDPWLIAIQTRRTQPHDPLIRLIPSPKF